MESKLANQREPNDLDLIIFKPTAEQFEALKVLMVFDLITNRPKDVKQEEIKAYKFKKDELILDVVIANYDMPNLLIFPCGDIGAFRVNSISGVIKAKASYKFRMNEEDSSELPSTKNTYARAKDMLDFQELKNLNFNM